MLGLGLGVDAIASGAGGVSGSTDFILTIRTTTASESFTIPTTGSGYNYDVDWGDGNTSGTITDNLGSNLLGDATISNAGSTTLVVTGDSFTSTSPSGDSGSSLRPRLLWNTLTVGKRYRVQINFTVNSGTLKWAFYNGTAYEYEQETTTSVDFTFTCNNASNVFFAIDGREIYDLSATFTIQEVIATHTYATAGDYDVKISGTFPRIYFNNTGDKAKVISVDNLGVVGWTSFEGSFFGCNNLTGVDFGNCDISSVVNFTSAFRSCTSLTDFYIRSADTSNIEFFTNMFLSDAVLENTDLNNLNTDSAEAITNMLFGCDAFDYDLSSWNISSLTAAANFMNGATGLSTANYDATLIGWEATLQAAFPGGSGYTPTISINFGGSTYTAGGAAETARTSLVNNFGWTITDGGTA